MQVGALSGWSLVRAEQDRRGGDAPPAREDGPRYPYGFFARYLRDHVFAKMDVEGWRQYQVADWVGIPDDALSVYLNRHAHPTPERRRLLSRLGCDDREMVEAELLDKLHLWMRTHGVERADVARYLETMGAYEAELAARRARERSSALSAVGAAAGEDRGA